MRIVIAGGTGFLGNPLAWAWAEESHDVRVLTRSLPVGQAQHESGTGSPGITRVGWNPDGTPDSVAREIVGTTAVINLAGASIAGRRWSEEYKKTLLDSRVLATRTIASAIAAAAAPPEIYINGSAVGYYGNRGSEALSEDAAPGDDFLGRMCAEWEAEAKRAARPGMRLVWLRSGLVLERGGGVLPQMSRPFRFFAGGPVGSGRQYMPWIHRLDWIEMVRWLVDTPKDTKPVSGPVNATAPHPVTNAQFARALGRALRRPALVPAPAFALKIVLGEMAEAVLAGQRAIPAAALAHGYHFRYPEIDIAFRGIFGDS